MPTAHPLYIKQIVKNVYNNYVEFRNAFIASVLSVLPRNSIGTHAHVSPSHIHLSPLSHSPKPLSLSTVRIVNVKKVYDDGTIADFNATSTARRLLLRVQVGVEVDYYVTAPQSQVATKALLSQNSTRAAMAKFLRSNQSNAVLFFPRFGDTVPPSFAPTPAPTVKTLSYSAIVSICVLAGVTVLVGSIFLGIYGRHRHMKRKEWKIQHKLDMNEPDVSSPDGSMDLEGGERRHDVFQRPRLFNEYHGEDGKLADDDMDKDSSDLSSIALSVTEVLTPMISSGPPSILIKSGEIIGVSSDKSGSGRGTGSSVNSTRPLHAHLLARKAASAMGEKQPSNDKKNLLHGRGKDNHEDENLSEDDGLMDLDYYASMQATATEKQPVATSSSSFMMRASFAGILRAHNEHNEPTSSNKEVERPPDLNIHDAFRGP